MITSNFPEMRELNEAEESELVNICLSLFKCLVFIFTSKSK